MQCGRLIHPRLAGCVCVCVCGEGCACKCATSLYSAPLVQRRRGERGLKPCVTYGIGVSTLTSACLRSARGRGGEGRERERGG